MMMLLLFVLTGKRSSAQSQEMQQLLLNIEKLSQLKSILADMKKGYQIYEQGYGMISNLSKGNFNLHDTFLTGLWAVSPVVRHYGRIADILTQQASIVTEYHRSFKRFKSSGLFRPGEISYISGVYDQLVRESLTNLDELATILTAGKLRMSDAERIRAIDRIYNSSSDKLDFLRYFNRRAGLLGMQRSREASEDHNIGQLYGITPNN
ncbi:TerB family tellurite resistance protein [Mucilaginibacter conchicola]|uniref:TerB family tellurite resistance protein n=2 Tax=Mucilaginibacter conchicola TaxID=2303333 RepID=A0A372NPC7_9SPHI|nr:TerB family tellurite resistance protein [Mucilaginibacter conchicola]